MTAVCYLINGKNRVKVRILFDTGSTINLINRNTVINAGLVGKPCQLKLTVAGGKCNKSHEEEIEFQLQSLDESFISAKYTATTCKTVTGPLSALPLDPNQYSYLKNEVFTEKYPQKADVSVDLLIDVEIFWELMDQIVKPSCSKKLPTLIKTKLGNVIGGAFVSVFAKHRSKHARKLLPKAKKHEKFSLLAYKEDPFGEVDKYYQRFMNLEDLGVIEKDTKYTKDEEEAVRLMEKLTTYDSEKKLYTTGLLWKIDPRGNLDSNFAPAHRIAISAKRKSVQCDKQEQVNNAYKEQIDAGFAEEVPIEEIKTTNPVYYIPTHPIYRPDRLTTKTRIVMNASAKCRSTGKSLNDCVYQGPSLLPDLVKILLNFRTSRYVTVCDISKMFWKVRINPPDADCLRYLWQWNENEEFKSYRALSVTFGVVSSPFQAIWTVLHHSEKFEISFPFAAQAIKETLYMDDVSALNNNFDEAVKTANQIYELLMLASMQPHKWNSNNLKILTNAGIPEQFWANVQNQKILGLEWNTVKDDIEFNFTKIIDDDIKMQTKRTLISQAARIFDPLGLISPFVLKAKLMFQRCWKTKIDWDDQLPEDINRDWQLWCDQIKKNTKVTRPRRVLNNTDNVWYAIFADASAYAYGTCVYMVNNHKSELIFSKTRVAPLKQSMTDENLTIARMELLAALIATRVGDYLKETLTTEVNKVKYFTDSLITLYRIRNGPEKYKTWVANRVKEIRRRTQIDQWHFVPGQLNPSDLASRSCDLKSLLDNEFWWEGPNFIRREESNWPEIKALTRLEAIEQNEFDLKEIKKVDNANVVLYCNKNKLDDNALLMYLRKETSEWVRLIRKTCWILKYLAFKSPTFKKKCSLLHDLPENFSKQKCISVAEHRAAELLWLRFAQQDSFEDELMNGEVKSTSFLQQFSPVIDEKGLIRSITRLQLSEILPGETKRPIILPKKNSIVEDYVLSKHRLLGHCYPGYMLYFLRRQFRVLGSKREIQRILNLCRKRNCLKPQLLAQRLAPLPTARIDEYSPWEKVASDFFGPFITCHECKIHNCPHEQKTKAWGCIFTCLQTRAIHLELVEDMTTATFLKAFIRMTSRRGMPNFVWSDNAKTYKGANKLLRRLFNDIDWSEVQNYASVRKIEWNFGIELAPQTNGVVERMIRSVKDALKRTFNTHNLPFTTLETILIEVEGIVNDRPLIAPTENDLDPMTITPATLCLGRHIQQLPFDQTEGVITNDFSRLQIYRKKLLNNFWNAWRKDYLLGQQAVSILKNRQEPLVKKGQIVLLREENLSKGRWRLARVIKPLVGRDKRVRRIQLKTSNGIIDRHINQIALLEGAPLEKHQVNCCFKPIFH